MSRIKFVGLLTVMLAFGRAGFAAPPDAACTLPPGLGKEMLAKYPGARLVTLADLNADDQKFFQRDQKRFPKEHDSDCPGLAKVDFYGDGRPTFALILIEGRVPKQTTRLLVAHRINAEWELRSLETADTAPMPVVWHQPPGTYQDVYGEKTIRAAHSVVVFCGYEGWAILYAWIDKDHMIKKIWIMD